MMVALAGAAQEGLRDPHEVLDPVVQVVLDARARARSGGDYATSDALRDGLLAAGVEVRDTPKGPVWAFTGSDDG
jgi:cysteinyl-tRNA synthetase